MKSRILESKGKKLSRVLGEALHDKEKEPSRWWHEHDGTCHPDLESSEFRCRKCRKVINAASDETECVADSIPLTPDNAFKWRDWAMDNFALLDIMQAMQKVEDFNNKTYADPAMWWKLESQPDHWLQAAALCAEKGE